MNLRDYHHHETLCPLPWSGFYLAPNGDVANCSISQKILGNINQLPIEDILMGIENQQIKQDLAQGIKTPACDNCWTFEQLNPNSSPTEGSNRKHFKTALARSVINIVDDTARFSLKQVDLRWRNTCNLACVYCGPDLSSTWAHELGETHTIDEAALESLKDYIVKHIKQLDYVYLCGGEPLLMKENLELISLIKAQNPNVFIRVNTNLTNINSPIYRELVACDNVHWIISVESTESIFEFVRYGAKWTSWLANLKQLQQDVGHRHKISFNMVWCSLTSQNIFESFDLFLKLGFHPNSFIVQPLQDPPELDVNLLSKELKQSLVAEIALRLQTADSKTWLYKSLENMRGHVNLTEYDQQPLVDFVAELDRRRGTNGLKLFDHLLK